MNKDSLILKLIELTKEQKIQWEYLDIYNDVCENLLIKARSPLQNKTSFEVLSEMKIVGSKKEFDSDNSFVACINENFIVIFAEVQNRNEPQVLGERLTLMIVPRTFKDITKWEDDNEGNLVRLHTLIKSNFPSSEDVVNDIFNM